MNKTVRKALVSAALAGMVLGATVVVSASPRPGDDSSKVAKHCCAGKNKCAGQGGCGADKGKNSCAGKGGCSTKTSCKGKPCTDDK
jgi:hypothetical protein